jgi:hypothetical protein
MTESEYLNTMGAILLGTTVLVGTLQVLWRLAVRRARRRRKRSG